jgi:hypothetical protein
VNTRIINRRRKVPAVWVLVAALIAACASASSGATASATAVSISVDARELSHRRMVSPEALTYSPYWMETTNGATRSVRIDVVTDPDTQNAATNTLITTENGTESAYEWTPASEAQPFCRLLLWTLDGGAPTGTPLVCDAVIGIRSVVAAPLSADTRTNSLQEVADANGMAGLTYSPLWANGTSVRLDRIRQRTDAVSVTTNSLFQSEANAEAVYSLSTGSLPSGHYILRHITLNASGQPTGDTLAAEFDIQRPRGTLISVF